MTSTSVGWRTGAFSFTVLSMIVVTVGWVAIQFDDQYEASPIMERMVVGVLGGMFAALILSPITAVLSVFVGVGAACNHRKRTSSV